MNRYVMVVVAVMALVVAGCAEDRGRPADIRLHLENTANFSFLELSVKDVRVLSEGRELEVERAGKLGDLLDPNHSPLLARVWVPESAVSIDVEVRLDDAGSFVSGEEAGYIQVDGAPIRFHAPIKALRLRDHAVLHVDALRSLATTRRNGERTFIPNLNVRY